MTYELTNHVMLEDKLERYAEICADYNDCSICPLRYDPPQFPHCEYTGLMNSMKEKMRE